MKNQRTGFTIVELLIVIVVIAILAAITTVAFNGIQQRARTSKINSDLTALQKAINAARFNNNERPLTTITGSSGTSGSCVSTATNSDLSDQSAYVACWNTYRNTLSAISDASNMNVSDLKDPWGWPYLIDEQQGVGGNNCGVRDYIGVMVKPHPQGSWATTNTINLELAPSCP